MAAFEVHASEGERFEAKAAAFEAKVAEYAARDSAAAEGGRSSDAGRAQGSWGRLRNDPAMKAPTWRAPLESLDRTAA